LLHLAAVPKVVEVTRLAVASGKIWNRAAHWTIHLKAVLGLLAAAWWVVSSKSGVLLLRQSLPKASVHCSDDEPQRAH